MLLAYPPQFVQNIYPSLEWKIKTDKKEIFLTFDDGPTPEVTDLVLDKLKRFEAKATFFCLGKNIEKHPELFQRIIDEGHNVGNHTYSHKNGWKTKTFDFINDIEKFNSIYQTNLFRPPYGRIKSGQIKLLKKEYKIIMWSILSLDYDSTISPERCAEISTSNWSNGAIIVFHDSKKAKRNMLFALDRVLEKSAKEGFTCSAI